MNKLKMLVLTGLAAATVGTGALAASPSASALPIQNDYCKSLLAKRNAYVNLMVIYASYGDWYWYHQSYLKAADYQHRYTTDCEGL